MVFTEGYQSFSVVDCLGQVLQMDYKHNDDSIMTSLYTSSIRNFYILWNWT